MALRALIFASFTASVLSWTIVTQEKWFDTLQKHEYTLVAFIDPDLAACKLLESEFAVLPKFGVHANAVVAIDCTQSTKLCADHDARLFPAVRLYYPTGWIDRYRGPKKAKDIADFVRRSSRPTLPYLGPANLTSFKTVDDIVVIANNLPFPSSAREHFDAVSKRWRDTYSFAVLEGAGDDGSGGEIASKGGEGEGSVVGTGAVECYNNINGEKHVSVALDLATVASFERFLSVCATPLVPQLTRRSEGPMLKSGKSLVYFFTLDAHARNKFREDALPLAKRYRDYLHFVVVDTIEYPDMYPSLGLGSDLSKPGLTVQNPNMGQIFPYRGEVEDFSAQVVEAFVTDIVEGRVPAYEAGKPQVDKKAAEKPNVEEGGHKVDHDEL